MYEGEAKSCYGGIALDGQKFLLATYLTDLTGPDEAPYMTGQFSFDVDAGWGTAVWYEEEFITAYTMADRPVALSRDGRLYDAGTAQMRDHPDAQVTTHFGAITADGAQLFVAGDNGRFWAGPTGAMAFVPNPFYRALPGPDSPLAEQIAWGQAMQQMFCVLYAGQGDVIVGGARGFLARDRGTGFVKINMPVASHVTGLVAGGDGSVYLCGHSPSSFVARLAVDNSITMLHQSADGPAIRAPQFHDGALHVAAPGPEGGVFVLDGARLRKAPFSDIGAYGQAWHLDQRGSTLWAVFERALVRIAGGQSTAWSLPKSL